jgi:16S rRNA (adenine1518-N6/adenine1519-N6)-dimethyltransferase
VDPDVLARIADAAGLTPGSTVLEVGAGRGALTQALVDAGAEVVAVELDEFLCRVLRQRFAATAAVRIINANLLDYPPTALLEEAGLSAPYAVVANIPYYITAPLLRHFLEAELRPVRLILTVQREVAESLAATPGTMSLLTVSVQFYASVELLFRIGADAFRPRPRVESAVVRIDVMPRPRVDVADRELFFDVVRAGFRQPRKQLHNALSQGLWLPAGAAEPILESAGVDPQRRAQTLSLNEWKAVYEAYQRARATWQAAERSR